ncbi:MAG: flagellar assembly protein FliH [Alteromonadaceae bacterium]|jgi:flagellar assembly protein FliH
MADDNSKTAGLSEEDAELVKNWHLPDVEDETSPSSSSSKTNAMGRSVDWYYSRRIQEQLEVVGEEEIKPLTAEDIESIRQAAYDEGILQGHEEGFEKGQQEGLEKGYGQGFEKGLTEGNESGFAQGEEAVAAQVVRWQVLVQQLNSPLMQLNEVVEHQLVELSVKLAEAVIGVEVRTSDTIIFNTLKECIDALPFNDSNCQVGLNPNDFALVSERFDEEELAERGWRLKAEPAIEQGGCIVESRTSVIDRTLKERLKSTLDRFLLDSGIKDKADE